MLFRSLPLSAPFSIKNSIKRRSMDKQRTLVRCAPWLFGVLLLKALGTTLVSITSSSSLYTNPFSSDSVQTWRRLQEEPNKSSFDPTVSLPLFQASDYTVIGPTIFPMPSLVAGKNAVPFLKPVFGTHRKNTDAVFIFATEYQLMNYQCFIETLRSTGFGGDLVMAVSIQDWNDPNKADYLKNEPNVVVYAVELSCFNAELEAVSSAKGGSRVCQIHELFAVDADTSKGLLQDPRKARTMQTLRYEFYWIWSLAYDKHSWIMLLDARDSFFQTNPFVNVPREADTDRLDGILYFYGENPEATRIGLSKKNKQWLTLAYGHVVASIMENKPTICSGSTMGEQIAIESYLRAMVAESDETGVIIVGADQGFHNFLYYANKLSSADTIREIQVFGQGMGAINNLGAMRTKPLEDWGNGKIIKVLAQDNITVYNWDGSISSVVHQFDRHKVLSEYMYKRKARQFQREWLTEKEARGV